MNFRPQLEILEDRDVPSTLTVTSSLGFGPGTLREEIAIARSGDTIVFDKSVAGTIDLLSGSPTGAGAELMIDKNLDIEGPGGGKLAISGHLLTRVFEVAAGAQVTISGLTIENGNGGTGAFDPVRNDGNGLGILNYGTLTLSGCNVSHNQVRGLYGLGGAIYNAGTLTLSNTTVTKNDGATGQSVVGGIYNDSAGTLTISYSIVNQNHGYDLYNLGQFTEDSHSKIGVIGS
jgi:hypothetical protein